MWLQRFSYAIKLEILMIFWLMQNNNFIRMVSAYKSIRIAYQFEAAAKAGENGMPFIHQQ